MIAYYFRFVDEKNEPTGWYGMAVAGNKEQMFWQIDTHGDPYCCQIISACRDDFSFCAKADEDDAFHMQDSLEVYDMPAPNDKRWKTPKWKRDDAIYETLFSAHKEAAHE